MNFTNQSDLYQEATLLKIASDGDLDAFNELVLAHQHMAYSHALALLNNPDLAEDVTQESFIRAFRALPSFRQGSFRGWMLKIITNSAYDLLRKSKRQPSQPLFSENEHGEEIASPAWMANPAASVQDSGEQNEFSRCIHEMIGELPEPSRNVLTLVDLYEMDYAETADVLKVPIGTIKSRLAHARLQLSKKLRKVKNRQLCLYCPA